MKKLKNTIGWVFHKGLIAALLWYAVVEHVDGARNVAYVLLWLSVLLLLFAFGEPAQKALLKDGQANLIPNSLRRLFNYLVIGFLVWFGEWWLALPFALAAFMHSLALFNARQQAKKEVA